MDLNNLSVKLTSNVNYQSLQNNKKEQVNALIKGYEDYAFAMSSSFYENLKELQDKELKRIKRNETWGTILNVGTLGAYSLVSGVVNGVSDYITGLLTMGTNIANNIGQIFVSDEKIASKDFWKEIGGDVLYAFTDPIIGIADGLARGGMSVANIFGLVNDETFNRSLESIGESSNLLRNEILSLGDYQSKPKNFDVAGVNIGDKDMTKEHTFDWAREFSTSVANSGTWFNNNVTPHIAGIVSLGTGYAIEELGMGQVGEFLGGTMESVGRMIPAILATHLGGGEEGSQLASAIATSYFFSSSFGGSFNEAIAKGVNIEDAYAYAYSNAMVETLAEQIGGVKLGKLLPSNIGKAMFEEGMEEIYSELVSAGLESIRADGDVNNDDIIQRGVFAFLGGALSGGIFASGGKFIGDKSTYGRTANLNNEVIKMYKNNGYDYAKTQNAFNKQLNNTLNSYNNESRFDRYLEKGMEGKKETLQRKVEYLNSNPLTKSLIEFNDKTQRFQLTKQGYDMTQNLEGYMKGRQGGVNLDVDNLAISKEYDGGIDHDKDIIFATKEDIKNLNNEVKQGVVNDILNNNRNIAFVKNMDTLGFYMSDSGFMYIDISMNSGKMITKVTSHELLHKIKNVNPKGYNKLLDIFKSKEVQEGLINAGIYLMNENEIEFYTEIYMEETNNNISKTQELLNEELLANFIEKIITSEKTLEKVFNISPNIISNFNLETEGYMMGVDKRLAKFEKLFIKYGKLAKKYNQGSLINAVNKGIEQTTYIKVNGKILAMPKEITGFFNSNSDYNLDASLDETHYIVENGGEPIERKYSEFSKKELKEFFDLFDVNGNVSIEDVVENLLKEYDDIRDYREIVGTKYTYIWSILQRSEAIANEFKNYVDGVISNKFEDAINKGNAIKDDRVEGLYRFKDANEFREIFALNYIISNPNFVASVSLHTSEIYKEYSKYMGIFNDGKGGFALSKDVNHVDINYRKEMKKEYGIDNVFEDMELNSVFNNGNKITPELINFMTKELKPKNIIATNEKLESIYEEWGFKHLLNSDGEPLMRYPYWNVLMSEWSNSYNNFLAYNGEINKKDIIYANLRMKKPIEKRLTLETIKDKRVIVETGYKTLDNFLKNNPGAFVEMDFYEYKAGEHTGFIYLGNSYVNTKSGDFYSSVNEQSMKEFSDTIKYVKKLTPIEVVDYMVEHGEQEFEAEEVIDYIDKNDLTNELINKIYDYFDNQLDEKNITFEDYMNVRENISPRKKIVIDKNNSIKTLLSNLDINTIYDGIWDDISDEYGYKVEDVMNNWSNQIYLNLDFFVEKEKLDEIINNDFFGEESFVYQESNLITSYALKHDRSDMVESIRYSGSDLNLNNESRIEVTLKDGYSFSEDFDSKTKTFQGSEFFNTISDTKGVLNYFDSIVVKKEATINEQMIEKGTLIEKEVATPIVKEVETPIVQETIPKRTTKRGDISIGIDNDFEVENLNLDLKESYTNYNKANYLYDVTQRRKRFKDIDFDDLKTKSNGEKRVAIINELSKKYEHVINFNFNRSQLYNHMFNNVLQEIILQLDSNFDGNQFINYDNLIDSLEKVVSNTMPYLDNTFNNNDVNKLNERNPEGFQYTRLINWAFRELNESKNIAQVDEIMKSRRLAPLFDMIDAIVNMDLSDNDSIVMAMAGIDNFYRQTNVQQVNSFSLHSGGKYAQTIPNVLKQNEQHIDNLLDMVGYNVLVDENDATKGYKKKEGLLGNYKMFDRFSGTRLDMYAFGNIFGMFMEDSTGNVMTKRIYDSQLKQLEVSNAFYDYFERDGYIKKNSENINALEKETTKLTNLKDASGNDMVIPNSQVMYLRSVMLREIVRDRMIENGFRGGSQSNRFGDGNIIFIRGNVRDGSVAKGNQMQGKIENSIELFKELDNVVNNHHFMKNYNNKVLNYFDLMYDFENARNKDISGLELTNDKDTISMLNDSQKAILTRDLGEVDITNIYVPMRVEGTNAKGGAGSFNINSVIDLGIDDGMVMGITENNNPPLITSINNIVPSYTKSVANFYGLYRTVNDLNILFNKNIKMEDGKEITLTTKVNELSPYIIPYYEKLLRDMSGYGINVDDTSKSFNKMVGTLRRNFFKASLGLNVKVITTQFASMFTLANIYGGYDGNSANFTKNMIKNMVGKGSKTKAQYLIDNSVIYKDRARNSTYEISEATSGKFNKGKFNEITEMFMQGINMTDSMINRAFFITLVDNGMSEHEAMLATEEAINRYQSSGLAISKNELLRTENEMLRIFTKFMGEPMKIVSNMEESVRNMKMIERFNTHQSEINNMLDNKLEAIENEHEEMIKRKNDLEEAMIVEKDKEKYKAMEKEVKSLEKSILDNETNIEETKKNNEHLKKQIQTVINNKDKVKKLLASRTSALITSVTYQALLGVAFGMIRGNLGDRDEEESVWSFMGKQFGWQMASEMVSFLPFGRDAYGMIIDRYSTNKIGELQSIDDLLGSINGILTDISNGGSFNFGKHIRKVSLHLGQILGIPTRQIERLFTTPASHFMKSANYSYKDSTGQFISSKELNNAIKNGDDKLVETIISRKMRQKNISLTQMVDVEINRLARSGVVVNPSGVPNSFTIDGIEYKNNKDKFSKVYDNASFVIEKLITHNAYNKLDDEHKGRLIKAVFNYYHQLAKQEVSGVEIFTRERTYTMNQAYSYFRDRIPYYLNMQKKSKKK